ncbi:MAG: protoporphyrinogen oxidase, partial [Magnetococcales bacterium]|nr:protoporphyrinogen oxidase [Magnetococcales bacterium]
AIEPFISGVYAGDPKRLSIRAAIPRIYALEEKHGSLIRGAIAMGRVRKGMGLPKGRMISFQQGMGELPAGIVKQLPEGSVRSGCRVVGLTRLESGWQVAWQQSGESGHHQAEHLIMALPASAAAGLIRPMSEQAADLLEDISYAPIATLAVGHTQKQVGHPLNGFGFLIPRREKIRLLGGLFSSTLFKDRAPEGRTLITAFMGGTMDQGFEDLSDDAVLGQMLLDLSQTLKIDGEADFAHLTRYERAIPQYVMGHGQRLAKLDQTLDEACPGLIHRANWSGGVSVADCVLNAERCAQSLAQHIAL